ncbi:MAG TPA: metal ABC transporter permease, partial [Rectinema sp.]|nr:metal ABC transporter permease [Rectinema sp.]
MMELLKIPAFGRAFVALFACGMAFPILGIYILSLDLIPVRFGVMHLSLLGATIGLIVGIDPIFLAMLFSIGAGFAVSALSSRKTGGDSGGAMALLMTASLGIVFILFYKANVHAIEAFNLFWGNVLALDRIEV